MGLGGSWSIGDPEKRCRGASWVPGQATPPLQHELTSHPQPLFGLPHSGKPPDQRVATLKREPCQADLSDIASSLLLAPNSVSCHGCPSAEVIRRGQRASPRRGASAHMDLELRGSGGRSLGGRSVCDGFGFDSGYVKEVLLCFACCPRLASLPRLPSRRPGECATFPPSSTYLLWP